MPAGGAVALGVGTGVAGLSSFFGGKSQRKAAQSASQQQLALQLEAIKQQRRLTEKGIKLARDQFAQARIDLAPLKQIGLKNLQLASDLTDPNSAQSIAERAAYQKVLSQNLAARGLTASGAEIAGLGDFELGLGQQRRDLATNLGNVGVNTLNNLSNLRAGYGQLGANLYSGLGNSIGNIVNQGASNQANLALAQGQAQAQGITGFGNALQTGLLGLTQLQQQNQQNAFLQSLFNPYTAPPNAGINNYRFR